MRAILYDFDPGFEAGSLDEAYLDITEYCQQHSLTGQYYAHLGLPLSAITAMNTCEGIQEGCLAIRCGDRCALDEFKYSVL